MVLLATRWLCFPSSESYIYMMPKELVKSMKLKPILSVVKMDRPIHPKWQMCQNIDQFTLYQQQQNLELKICQLRKEEKTNFKRNTIGFQKHGFFERDHLLVDIHANQISAEFWPWMTYHLLLFMVVARAEELLLNEAFCSK